MARPRIRAAGRRSLRRSWPSFTTQLVFIQIPAKSSELRLVSMARFAGIIGKSPRDQPVLIEAHQPWRCVVFPFSAPALLVRNSFRLLSSCYYGFNFIAGGNLKSGWVWFTTVQVGDFGSVSCPWINNPGKELNFQFLRIPAFCNDDSVRTAALSSSRDEALPAKSRNVHACDNLRRQGLA
jgi:hypothetical protein